MKRGFTDKLYLMNLIFVWVFVIVCIVITFASGKCSIADFSIIQYGIPAVFAELSLHTGFVIWKAKVENMAKFNKKEELERMKEETWNG